MPGFSIVIPNFNSGAVLERAIRSIVDQGRSDVQIILADGGSTDESSAIIDRYAQVFDPLIRGRDNGQVDALNRGFEHARHEIRSWLCADDELLPGALEEAARVFEGRDVEMVAGACEYLFPDGSTIVYGLEDESWRELPLRNRISQPSVFWKESLERRVGKLDDSYALAFDWDYWCRMQAAGAKVGTTERVLSRYHFSGHNKSSRGGTQHVEESTRILERYAADGRRRARLYRAIYDHFDLHGCFDHPWGCSWGRGWAARLTMMAAAWIYGRRWVELYNWHFASRQERGLEWWKP